MNKEGAAKVFALFAKSFVPQVLPTQTTSNGFCGFFWPKTLASIAAAPSSFAFCLVSSSLTSSRAYDIPHDIQSVLEIDFIDQSRRTAACSHCATQSPKSLTFSPLPPSPSLFPPPPLALCDTRTCRNLLKYIQLCCKLPCPALPRQPGGKQSKFNTSCHLNGSIAFWVLCIGSTVS